jgi:hypothetical protein
MSSRWTANTARISYHTFDPPAPAPPLAPAPAPNPPSDVSTSDPQPVETSHTRTVPRGKGGPAAAGPPVQPCQDVAVWPATAILRAAANAHAGARLAGAQAVESGTVESAVSGRLESLGGLGEGLLSLESNDTRREGSALKKILLFIDESGRYTVLPKRVHLSGHL